MWGTNSTSILSYKFLTAKMRRKGHFRNVAAVQLSVMFIPRAPVKFMVTEIPHTAVNILNLHTELVELIIRI